MYFQVLRNKISSYVNGLGLGPTSSALWGIRFFVENIIVEDSANDVV